MHESKYTGEYEYKGFTIWNAGDKEWICEPDWSIEAIENLKSQVNIKHPTIAKAKKWVREEGIHLKENDYIK